MSKPILKILLDAWRGLEGLALLKSVLQPREDVRVAVSSSFGAESAVLLDLIAQVDVSTPVITVDTGKLFEETHSYRDRLVDHFGLSDVRVLEAATALLESSDPEGDLHKQDPDLCCQVRKVMPHAQAAADFDVLITGRKRFHGDGRNGLASVHMEGAHIKVNPLVTWSEGDIQTAFSERHLPPHPLVAEGYRSIGCAVCTHKVGAGENARDGRWAGTSKTECGLHLSANDLFKLEGMENGL